MFKKVVEWGLVVTLLVSSASLLGAEKKRKLVQPKKVIAVTNFENKVSRVWWDKSWQIGKGMSEMLVTELYTTKKFTIVERQAIQDILTEQKLGMSGLVNESTAVKIGNLAGAQILIRGAVTQFADVGGGGGLAVGPLTVGGKFAQVGIDLRIYDVNTGVVLAAHHSDGKATSVGLGFRGGVKGIRFGTKKFFKSPVGKATQKAIKDAVKFIIDETESIPWHGRVITAKGDKIYINAGKDAGVKVNDIFEIFAVGEPLIDPETGLNLGSEETLKGKIKIIKVADKFSIARVIKGRGFLRNDLVRLPKSKK